MRRKTHKRKTTGRGTGMSKPTMAHAYAEADNLPDEAKERAALNARTRELKSVLDEAVYYTGNAVTDFNRNQEELRRVEAELERKLQLYHDNLHAGIAPTENVMLELRKLETRMHYLREQEHEKSVELTRKRRTEDAARARYEDAKQRSDRAHRMLTPVSMRTVFEEKTGQSGAPDTSPINRILELAEQPKLKVKAGRRKTKKRN